MEKVNAKRQMECNNYLVVGGDIYPDTTKTSVSSNIQFSMCDTSMGSNIQIIFKEG
jgi:hypothetical protein